MADTDKVKIVTKITSFDDVQKSLQEVENKINSLIKSVNDVSEKETSETEGKSGDINITRNADGTYGLETCTNEGWKKMYASNKTTADGTSEVYLGDKPRIPTKLSTEHMQDTRYLTVTPDYDSGWIDVTNDDTRHSLTHSLNAQPRMFIGWFTPDSTYNSGDHTMYYPMDLGGLIRGGSSSWAGVEFRITKTQIEYSCDASHHVYSNYRLDSGGNSWTDYNDGYMRLLLWK